MYSTCCSGNCCCKGWRLPEEHRHKDVEVDHCPNVYDLCRNVNCKHPLGKFWGHLNNWSCIMSRYFSLVETHFAHIKNISNEQTDQLLSIIVDAEVLYTTLGLQKDKFIKKIYSFLFTFLHSCVSERKPAIIQGPLGDPPFQKPSIQKIIKNFVVMKYDKLRENNEAEFKVITEVARTFLNCYNNWWEIKRKFYYFL